MQEGEKLLTVKDVANYLSCAESSVYQWIREGRIEAVKVGSNVRISQDAVKDFLSVYKKKPTLIDRLFGRQ